MFIEIREEIKSSSSGATCNTEFYPFGFFFFVMLSGAKHLTQATKKILLLHSVRHQNVTRTVFHSFVISLSRLNHDLYDKRITRIVAIMVIPKSHKSRFRHPGGFDDLLG